MITDEEFEKQEAEMQALFDSGSESSAPDEGRVERIVQRAKLEAICKDSADFIFNSFGPALSSLLGALLGSAGPEQPAGADDEKKKNKGEKDEAPDPPNSDAHAGPDPNKAGLN